MYIVLTPRYVLCCRLQAEVEELEASLASETVLRRAAHDELSERIAAELADDDDMPGFLRAAEVIIYIFICIVVCIYVYTCING